LHAGAAWSPKAPGSKAQACAALSQWASRRAGTEISTVASWPGSASAIAKPAGQRAGRDTALSRRAA